MSEDKIKDKQPDVTQIQSASEYDDLTIDNVARWYVVHTYSGHEQKVKDNILKIVESRGMGDLILKINIPTEEKVEIKNGQRKSRKVKQFIGYILIKMKVTNESWYVVRNTQGVTGFVGQGKKPVPLTAEEVRRLGIEKVIVNLKIKPGDTIKVINGPFEGHNGEVIEVDEEHETLRAKIFMFGRETPVDLEYEQIDKL